MVEGSNYVDIGFKIDPRTGRIIMMGAIDNLVKGAAGQAVQNMNLMFGLKESEGLELVPMFPRDRGRSQIRFYYVPNRSSGCPKAVRRVSLNEDERNI